MISVVVATYNGEKFIREQLSSILGQTVPADEVVICDDGSTDGTADIVRDFISANAPEGWRLIVNEKNLGFSANFLNGVSLTRGDLVFLADQDDVWLPERIEKTAAVMADGGISAVSCRYDVIDGEGQPVPKPDITYYSDDFGGGLTDITPDSLIGCSWVRGFSLCFRGRLRELLRPLKLNTLLGHDWYLAMLSALSGRFCFLNLCLAHYRAHGENISMSAEKHRATLKGDPLQQRKDGLRESTEAHGSLLTDGRLAVSPSDRESISRFIAFENARLAYLDEGGFFRWAALGFCIGEYRRYYKSLRGAFRVWSGDLLYRVKYRKKN